MSYKFNKTQFNKGNFNIPAVTAISVSFFGKTNSYAVLNYKIIRLVNFNALSETTSLFNSMKIVGNAFNSESVAETNFIGTLINSDIFNAESTVFSDFTNSLIRVLKENTAFGNSSYKLNFNIYDYMANLRTFFPHLNYMAKEKDYEDFIQGEHIVTNAYDDGDNDYLGFTDDYDFCWGAETEGEPLEEISRYTDEEGREIISANEYNKDNGRLWGVYTKSAGEIYLLKANEDLTAWERHEQLTFVPSGSRRATIEFRPDGHYEIAVEFIPAGSETYEVWVLSYPYEGDSIRQVADGTEPQLTSDFNNNPVLFYTDNEQYNLYYREYTLDYGTENLIDIVYQAERQLHFKHATKATEPTGMGVGDYGYLMAFHKRDDDYQPYKYVITDKLTMLNAPVFSESYNLDSIETDVFWQPIGLLYIGGNADSSQEPPKEVYELGSLDISIAWVDISALSYGETSPPTENYELGSITMNNITWVDISAIESDNNIESYDLDSVNLDSILWVEV